MHFARQKVFRFIIIKKYLFIKKYPIVLYKFVVVILILNCYVAIIITIVIYTFTTALFPY